MYSEEPREPADSAEPYRRSGRLKQRGKPKSKDKEKGKAKSKGKGKSQDKSKTTVCPEPNCLKVMKLLTVREAYEGTGMTMASCDYCNKTLHSHQKVYHCPISDLHDGGFDLCTGCGESNAHKASVLAAEKEKEKAQEKGKGVTAQVSTAKESKGSDDGSMLKPRIGSFVGRKKETSLDKKEEADKEAGREKAGKEKEEEEKEEAEEKEIDKENTVQKKDAEKEKDHRFRTRQPAEARGERRDGSVESAKGKGSKRKRKKRPKMSGLPPIPPPVTSSQGLPTKRGSSVSIGASSTASTLPKSSVDSSPQDPMPSPSLKRPVREISSSQHGEAPQGPETKKRRFQDTVSGLKAKYEAQLAKLDKELHAPLLHVEAGSISALKGDTTPTSRMRAVMDDLFFDEDSSGETVLDKALSHYLGSEEKRPLENGEALDLLRRFEKQIEEDFGRLDDEELDFSEQYSDKLRIAKRLVARERSKWQRARDVFGDAYVKQFRTQNLAELVEKNDLILRMRDKEFKRHVKMVLKNRVTKRIGVYQRVRQKYQESAQKERKETRELKKLKRDIKALKAFWEHLRGLPFELKLLPSVTSEKASNYHRTSLSAAEKYLRSQWKPPEPEVSSIVAREETEPFPKLHSQAPIMTLPPISGVSHNDEMAALSGTAELLRALRSKGSEGKEEGREEGKEERAGNAMSIHAQYSDRSYWDKHYLKQMERGDSHFEWFCRFDDVKSLLEKELKRFFGSDFGIPILEIGSGTSDFAANLVLQSGYSNITCVDFSNTAIQQLQDLNQRRFVDKEKYPLTWRAHEEKLANSIRYLEADARFLELPDNSVKCVIDKGTLDAVDCGNESAASDDRQKKRSYGETQFFDNFEDVCLICTQVHRMLVHNGIFVIITSRSSQKRLEFVGELKARTPEPVTFNKVIDEKIETQLKDWRDGESMPARVIILQAKKKA